MSASSASGLDPLELRKRKITSMFNTSRRLYEWSKVIKVFIRNGFITFQVYHLQSTQGIEEEAREIVREKGAKSYENFGHSLR